MILPALAAVVFAGAAAAADLCAEVRLEGRLLPAGYASVSEPARAESRVEGGYFCAKIPPEGGRLRLLAPMARPEASDLPPLELQARFTGLQGPASSYWIKADGIGWRLTQADRRVRTIRGRLALVVEPSTGPLILRGTLDLPNGTTAPALVFAAVVDTTGEPALTAHLAWVDGGGRREFALPIARGRLLSLWARTDGLATSAWRLARGRPNEFAGAELAMVLSTPAAVSAELRSSSPAPRAWLQASGIWDDEFTADGEPFDRSGRATLDRIKPGFIVFKPVLDAESALAARPALRGAWLDAGQFARLSWTLTPAAQALPPTAAPEAENLSSPPDEWQPWMEEARLRWAVALEEDGGDVLPSRLLWPEEAEASFIQERGGSWRARLRGRPVTAAPGRYRTWLVESTWRYARPSLRVVAGPGTAELVAGAATALDAPALPQGKARIEAEFSGWAPPAAASLRKCLSRACLHSTLAPRLDLRDARGRYRGSAFMPLSFVEWGAAIRAAEEDGPQSPPDASRRWSEIDGLEAGDYALELRWGGRRLWSGRVRLSDGGRVRARVRLNPAPSVTLDGR